MDSKSLLIQATEMDVAEDNRQAPELDAASETNAARLTSSASGGGRSPIAGLKSAVAVDGEGGQRVSAVDAFVRQQAQASARPDNHAVDDLIPK